MRGDIIKDYKNILLTDGIVSLMPVSLADADVQYRAIRESLAEISPWLPFAHKDYSIKETKDFLKKRCPIGWKKDTEYSFKIIDPKDNSFMGGCGLNAIDFDNHRANLGYWVRTSRTRDGVATAATLLLAKWGFKVAGLRRIEILVAVGNQRSQRVAEKAGAHREGVLRNRLYMYEKYHDAVMYSLIPGDI